MMAVSGRVPSGQRQVAQAEPCQDLDCSRHVGVHRAGSLSRPQRPRRCRVGRRTKVPSERHTHRMPLSVPFTREPMPVPHRATARAWTAPTREDRVSFPFRTRSEWGAH
jgi:hypothetical protein